MGRTKGSSGAVASAASTSVISSNGNAANGGTDVVSADIKIKEILKELNKLCHQIQEERLRGEHNLTNITKTHERIQSEQKISQYYKSKLKSLYNTARQDAESEAELLRKALDSIHEIKQLRESGSNGRNKPIMRRGVLMSLLLQNALTLPLWIGKPGERPPPLCGAVPAESNYIAKTGDKIAARVKGSDGEENWILAEVVTWNSTANKYEVDDIDAEEGKE